MLQMLQNAMIYVLSKIHEYIEIKFATSRVKYFNITSFFQPGYVKFFLAFKLNVCKF